MPSPPPLPSYPYRLSHPRGGYEALEELQSVLAPLLLSPHDDGKEVCLLVQQGVVSAMASYLHSSVPRPSFAVETCVRVLDLMQGSLARNLHNRTCREEMDRMTQEWVYGGGVSLLLSQPVVSSYPASLRVFASMYSVRKRDVTRRLCEEVPHWPRLLPSLLSSPPLRSDAAKVLFFLLEDTNEEAVRGMTEEEARSAVQSLLRMEEEGGGSEWGVYALQAMSRACADAIVEEGGVGVMVRALERRARDTRSVPAIRFTIRILVRLAASHSKAVASLLPPRTLDEFEKRLPSQRLLLRSLRETAGVGEEKEKEAEPASPPRKCARTV